MSAMMADDADRWRNEWDGIDAVAANDASKAPTPPPPPPWALRVGPCVQDWFLNAPPRRAWLLRDARAGDAGVLPLGKCGLLIAEGGVGKTMVVAQLSLAVSSHEPVNFVGCYSIPNQGRALLVLGEEDLEEAQRRLYNARRSLGAAVPEPGAIVVIGLAGVPCTMIESDDRGNPVDAPFLLWLRSFIKEHGPFSLIVLDPLSRFAGLDAETDNAAATRFIQATESLATESGATVVIAHHTNKMARGHGASVTGASARGSSAIYDGVRWAAALSADRVQLPDGTTTELVTLSVVKSNYSRKGDPVTLQRDEDNGGALVPLSQADRERLEVARAAADPSSRRRAAKEDERAQREQREAQARSEREAGEVARQADEDAVLDAILTERPGITARDLRAAMATRCAAGCGHTRVDRALERRRNRREES